MSYFSSEQWSVITVFTRRVIINVNVMVIIWTIISVMTKGFYNYYVTFFVTRVMPLTCSCKDGRRYILDNDKINELLSLLPTLL